MVRAVRERVREKMRVELAEQLYPLFALHGLDGVTAEQAARAVGISKATFFRYFASKEDAVLTAVRSLGSHFATTLVDMESLPGESLLELLRRSFESSVEAAESDPQVIRERVGIIWQTPSLRAGWSAYRREQEAELANSLMPFCTDPMLAQTSAVIALSLFDHALDRWLKSHDEHLRPILDEVFDHARLIDSSWVSCRGMESAATRSQEPVEL